MLHVPYKSGGATNVTDLAAGRVHLIFDPMPSLAPHVRAGRVRGLGVTSAKRVAAFPELPTVAEAGVPGFEVTVWGGIIVPAGVSKGKKGSGLLILTNPSVNKKVKKGQVY
jgi:tripartite-type tricarboxylate transporter receptor subunit TctC